MLHKRRGRLARAKLLVKSKSVGGEGHFVPDFCHVLLNGHISRTAATSLTFFHQNSPLVGGRLTHTTGLGMRWPHSVDSENRLEALVSTWKPRAGQPQAKSAVVPDSPPTVCVLRSVDEAATRESRGRPRSV